MIAPAQATLPDEGHAARMEDLDFDVIGSLQARKLAIEIEGCFSRCTANFLMFMPAYCFASVNRHVEDTTLRLSWLWNCCYFANRNPFNLLTIPKSCQSTDIALGMAILSAHRKRVMRVKTIIFNTWERNGPHPLSER
jgi:hypothetical protein